MSLTHVHRNIKPNTTQNNFWSRHRNVEPAHFSLNFELRSFLQADDLRCPCLQYTPMIREADIATNSGKKSTSRTKEKNLLFLDIFRFLGSIFLKDHIYRSDVHLR